jgi:poly(hydroxyalkanoate) depolymerase family esterase
MAYRRDSALAIQSAMKNFAPLPSGTFGEGRFAETRIDRGARHRFMLYEPMCRESGPAPLLVMLHGCRQSANAFAAGTRMNEAAEESGVFVLYPEQTCEAHFLRCWNWYGRLDQPSGAGDAALIVAMTRQAMLGHDIDPERVYVAGMSAGGAMAALLGRDYPDIYAAIGVHSGIPAGFAHDLLSALRVMSRGPQASAKCTERVAASGGGRFIASIVFHGDVDTTVHPSNGEAIHAGVSGEIDVPTSSRSVQATTRPIAGQRGFTRSLQFRAGGVTDRELWVVHGGGHAWSGGSELESDTDPRGPDASREMLRFFLQHRLAGLPCRNGGNFPLNRLRMQPSLALAS